MITEGDLIRRGISFKIYKKLRPHGIKAKEVLDDIEAGMTDPEIIEKYHLSPRAYRMILKKLVEAELISHGVLYGKSPQYRSMIDQGDARQHPRTELNIPVRVLEKETAQEGLVRDISAAGVRIAGLPAAVGDVKAFELEVDLLTEVRTVEFDAQCKWTAMRGRKNKYPVAGFEFTRISGDARGEIKRFMEKLVLSQSGEWTRYA